MIPADIKEKAGSLTEEIASRLGAYTPELIWLEHIITEALMQERCRTMELAIKRAIKAWPRAHTYASENADLYRAQDSVRDRIVQSLDEYLKFIRTDTAQEHLHDPR